MNSVNNFFKKILLVSLTGMALLVSGCEGAAKGVVYLCDDDRYMGAFRYVDVKNADGGSVGLSYALNSDGTQAIVSIGTCTVAAVVVPDTYNTIPVVGVAESGFASVTTMTSITLPAGGTFTMIGSQAFEDTVLTSIAIPSSVTALNPSTFLNCKSLVTVTFSGTSVVASIGDNCFAFDSALKNIQLPLSCSSVGDSSFKNCILLERFLFPKSVASFTIGVSAFDGCEKMGFIFFSTSVTSVGTYAFRGCTNGKAYFAGDIPSGYSSTGLWDYTYNSNETANFYLTIVATDVGDMGYNSGFYYIVNTGGTITIYYYDGSSSSDTAGSVDLVIPGTLDGRTVIGIGQYVFKDHTELKTITFPNSLTTLAIGCFEGCTNVTAVNFGTGLLTIGDYAFSYGTADAAMKVVTSLTIPASVTSIGNYAFYGFSLLTSLTFAGAAGNTAALSTIGAYAFADAGFSAGYSSTTVPTCVLTLPGTLTSIGNYAFYRAYLIRSVVFMTHYATDGTTVSPSLMVGTSADLTATYVFGNLLYLISVTLSANVTNIRSYAFATSTSNTNVNYAVMPSMFIPSTVTTMGTLVFQGRTRFTAYCAAASKPSGWDSAWAGTMNATEMTNVSIATPSYFNVATSGTTQRIMFTSSDGLIQLVEDSVGSGTTRHMTISRFVYDPNNTNDVTVSIAASYTSGGYSGYTFIVDKVGDGAFFNSWASGKKNLTTLNLPAAITAIGDFAFTMNITLATLYLTSGTKVTNTATFPTSLTSLGTYSFGSTPIVIAVLPVGISYLGVAATNPFLGCFLLTTITIPSACTTFYTENNVIYKKGATNYSELVYAASGYLGTSNTITIPAGALTLDDRSFAGERAVKYVKIPYSVTTVGNYAFYLISSPASAFGVATSMALISVRYYAATGYTTPAVTSLGTYSFYNCVNFTDMEFPSSLATIGANAFQSCPALKYCYTLPTQTSSDVTLGNLNLSGTVLTSIGTSAFQACTSLKSVNLPSTLVTLGSNAFYGDTGITSVSFAAATGTIDIGGSSFYGDTALASVTLPTGAGASTTIEDSAFYNCASLGSIYIPTTAKFAHSNGSGTNAPFYGCTGMSGIYLADTGTSYDARKTTAFKLGWNYLNANKTNYQIPFYCYAGPDDGTTRSTATDAVESDMLYWHYVGGVMTPWAS